MSAALVTGATGFVGRALAERLVADGWEVTALVRSGSDRARLPAGVNEAEADGADASVRAAVDQARPDVAFHLASRFLAAHETDDISDLVASNVLLGAQLAEACAGAGVTGLVCAGTSWQRFEGARYRPVNLYAATKQAFDDILRYYADATALRAITLQLFDTYGPGDPRRKLVALLADAARAGSTLDMSPGEQLVDLVHVDDVVEAFVVAARRLLDGEATGHETYGLSSGAPLSVRELVEVVSDVLALPIHVRWGERPYREREVMVPWRPERSLPGWAPAGALRERLRDAL